MKELAVYLLLTLGGQDAGAAKIKEVLSSVGGEACEDEISRLTTALEGKDLNEIIEVSVVDTHTQWRQAEARRVRARRRGYSLSRRMVDARAYTGEGVAVVAA